MASMPIVDSRHTKTFPEEPIIWFSMWTKAAWNLLAPPRVSCFAICRHAESFLSSLCFTNSNLCYLHENRTALDVPQPL